MSLLQSVATKNAANPKIVVEKKKKARRYAEEKLSFVKNANNIANLLESVEFTQTPISTYNLINAFENKLNSRIIKWMIKNKLYILPFKSIRKVLRCQKIYHNC